MDWGIIVDNAHAIEVKGVSKHFYKERSFFELVLHPFRKIKKITALDNVNLAVSKGELFGLLGPNGAGKTTLVKILATLLIPDSGAAYINGYDLAKQEMQVKKDIGFINGEERSFFWRLTGRENLEFFAALFNIKRKQIKQKINEVLRIVELEDKADFRFDTYSTGMKHRLSIARGLLNDPAILFMDEPTAGVDPVKAKKLRRFIKKTLIDDMGKTVLLTTQNLHEAQEICDRIAILANGTVKEVGTIRELQKKIGFETIKIKAEIKKEILGNISRIAEIISFTKHGDIINIDTSDSAKVLPIITEMITKSGGKLIDCNTSRTPLREIFEKTTEEKHV